MIATKRLSLTLAAFAAPLALSIVLVAAESKYPRIDAYAEVVRMVGIPIQEAINKVMEEHGGIPISASLQPQENVEGGFVYWIQTVRPAKEGMPASVWAIGIDANTGELVGTHNQTREKDNELAQQDKARELRGKERKLREQLMQQQRQEKERELRELEGKLQKQQNQPKGDRAD